jgi:hypothetical protein
MAARATAGTTAGKLEKQGGTTSTSSTYYQHFYIMLVT